jgi:hypothetical protein
MDILHPQAFIEAAPRCLPPRLARWAPHMLSASLGTLAEAFPVDVWTLAAVCDRESLGGDALKPRGPMGKGDGNMGFGLMQVDVRFHEAFLSARFGRAGLHLWKHPSFAFMYGAHLLAENLTVFAGELAPAVASYNASMTRVRAALLGLPAVATEAQRLAAVDSVTTGGNYASDVLARRARFHAAFINRAA